MIRRSLLLVCASAALSGCALLSSPDPVQLYRFGSQTQDAPRPPLAGAPIPLLVRPVDFPEAVRGDRILGVTGYETSYIGGARWVSPARELYASSLEAAFATQATRVRAIGQREASTAQRTLDINIQSFEAQYAAPGAAPVVVVSARARVLRYPQRTVVEETSLTVRQPAATNSVAAIVEAFDIAVRDLNTQLVSWTEATAAGG
jgi:cholesterol transport system auxiliary component